MSMFRRNSALIGSLLVLILMGQGRANADFYVAATASSNSNGPSLYGTLDLTTGQFTQISTLSVKVTALSYGPGNGLYAAATDGFLYSINEGVASRFSTASAPVPPYSHQLASMAWHTTELVHFTRKT